MKNKNTLKNKKLFYIIIGIISAITLCYLSFSLYKNPIINSHKQTSDTAVKTNVDSKSILIHLLEEEKEKKDINKEKASVAKDSTSFKDFLEVSGLSFKYPDNWTYDIEHRSKSVEVIHFHRGTINVATVTVTLNAKKVSVTQVTQIFTKALDNLRGQGDVAILSYDDAVINNIPIKYIKYRCTGENSPIYQVEYFFSNNSILYTINFFKEIKDSILLNDLLKQVLSSLAIF